MTESGGGNTELFGAWKTEKGIAVVGRQKATNGAADGAEIPTANVPFWAKSQPENESAILAFLPAANLENPLDGPAGVSSSAFSPPQKIEFSLFPNPTDGPFFLKNEKGEATVFDDFEKIEVKNALGQRLRLFSWTEKWSLAGLPSGLFFIQILDEKGASAQPFRLLKI